MSGDDSVSGFRPALGEITNRPAKRGASSDLDVGIKGRIECSDKSGDTVNVDSGFAKKICLANKGSSGVEDGGVELGELGPSVGDAGDASRDSCCGSSGGIPIGTTSCKNTNDEEVGYMSDFVDSSTVGLGSLACKGVGQLESSGMPNSSEHRKLLELNRCTRETQANGCANMNDGDDILKTCPCSFCVQATYIWSDLHYQDMKGRLAALKKSQKEARSLVNSYAKDMLSDVHSSRGGPSVSTKLESDLTDQWRSLFHHMEDIFVRETKQLQLTFAMLKDMKEDCKMDLERIAGVPSDEH